MNVPCHFCARVVDPDGPVTYQLVHGWARKRTAGGLNAIALRQPQQVWACETCVWRVRRGLDPLQGELPIREWSADDLALMEQMGLDPADVEGP